METPQLVQTLLLSLVTLFMTLRVLTRWGLMKAPGLDDYLSILAFCVYIARSATLYVGLQDHTRLDDAYRIILSFSVTLYRIVQSRGLSIAILLLAFATTVIALFEFFWTVFICRPITKLWTGGEGTCHPGNSWGIWLLVHGGVLLIVDVALGIIVPVIELHKLQMRMVLRVSVGVTIAVGSLASIATIARLIYTRRLFTSPGGAAEPLSIWMDVEFVNIICTAAIMKPLLRKMGVLSLTSVSGSGFYSASCLTYPGHGRGGMRIRVDEEVATCSETEETNLEGIVLVERGSRV